MSQKKSCHELVSTKRVLAWVNKQRVKLGWKPLKRLKPGYVGHDVKCSIAQSLSRKGFVAFVSGGPEISVFKGNGPDGTLWPDAANPVLEVPTPKYVQNWIDAFDSDKYPELVIHR